MGTECGITLESIASSMILKTYTIKLFQKFKSLNRK